MALKPHPMVLPPRGATNLYRLGVSGRWREIDADEPKEPAHAYIGILDDEGYAWVAHCKCVVHANCPLSSALNRACHEWDSASVQRRPVANVNRKRK